MFSQEEIDAVLNDAQQAVDTLVENVDGLSEGPQQAAPAPDAREDPSAPTAPSQPMTETQGQYPESIRRLLWLKVPVVVRLAEQKMSVDEVMKLAPGTILEFDRKCDIELDLLINNHQIGAGVAVKVDEHFGLRVTYIGDIRQRLDSLTR